MSSFTGLAIQTTPGRLLLGTVGLIGLMLFSSMVDQCQADAKHAGQAAVKKVHKEKRHATRPSHR